ncbi:MAG: LytTR family DNA-binding domain-containing protein [Bacteroidales bacterium]|nr:LytTR family DNA-binding domain-containing protein [Bacteroidales bacterium]
MDKLRTLIIEDEAPARELLAGILENYCHRTELIGFADGVQNGLTAIKSLKPDLVLLDVNLEDGNAFDLLREFNEIPFALIFVTAYENYALNAFRFSAVDYIMKPVNIDDLVKAVQKAADKLEQASLGLKLKNFFDNLNSKPEDKKIVLKTQESIHIVKLSDIIRCEADHNYCTFYFVNGKKIVVSRNLGEFEEMLNGLFFFRTHQSHLININHILSFEKNEGGYLKMADNSSVPVSKRKKEELLELFGRL